MGKDPSMPFYVNDWLSSPSVACMTLEQQGAYVRLLCYCWASQTASLPDDDNVLAKLSGMHEGWFNGGSCLVRKCFINHPSISGAITNDRLHSLWKERENWRKKSAEAGRKSGESRRKSSRSKTKEQTNQPSLLVQTKCEPNANSSSSSSSSSVVPLSSLTYQEGLILKEKERLQQNRLIPPRYDHETTAKSIASWMVYFPDKFDGKKFSDFQLDSMLRWAIQEKNWSHQDLEKSIEHSKRIGANKFHDPANDKDKQNGSSYADRLATPSSALALPVRS